MLIKISIENFCLFIQNLTNSFYFQTYIFNFVGLKKILFTYLDFF